MHDLPRKLNLIDLLALAIGNMIGAVIFLAPGMAARHLPSPEWILAAWAAAGLLSLAGALSFAELGAMMPHSGGQYVFLRDSLGRFWAFLFGWSAFVAIRSGGLASLAVAFATYLGHFVPMNPLLTRAVPVALLAALAAANYVGVQSGAAVQRLFTALKLGGLLTVIAAGFLTPGIAASVDSAAPITWSAFGAALVPCLWAYQGWFTVPMVAGEARNPSRNLPLSLGIGVATVMLLYLAANVAYLKVLTVAELIATPRVASDVMQRFLGPAGASVVAAAILLSITGALNAGILSGPRIYFAQARDGLFLAPFARVHPRYETPGFSIWAQTVWASLLALTGSYEKLIAYAAFASWFFYALTAVGLFVLRTRKPDAPRPYKVWAYPVTPAVFTLLAVAFLGNMLVTSPGPSGWGVLLIASGVPVYWLFARRQKPQR